MKHQHSSVPPCLQHNKIILINIIVILIFLINTFIFHITRVGNVKDTSGLRRGGVTVNGASRVTKFGTPFGAGSSYLRIHEKRSPPPESAPNNRQAQRRVIGPDDGSTIKTSDKWIIVTLNQLSAVNESYLSFLDTVEGWTSIIIGESVKTNHGCKTCLTLRPNAHQQDSNSTFINTVSIAINHGARQIYVMTSLHNVTSALKRMTSPDLQGIVYTGQVPFKPCTHFAQPLLSSGQSFSKCHDRNWVYSYTTGEFPPRKVIAMCEECGQNILEADSDYENIDYYHKNGTVYCDATTPNVAVNPKSFVETSFGNTLWAYESFWALFVFGMKGELMMSVSEIEMLRMSLIIQRLLWEINVSMVFVRSHDLNFTRHDLFLDKFQWGESRGNGNNNVDDYDDDIESKMCREKELSWTNRILGKFLYDWQCKNDLSMGKCVRDLAGNLIDSKFISGEQYRIILEFMSMLETGPFEYPDRLTGPVISVGSYIGIKSKTIRFWPSANNRHWSQNPFEQFCSRFNKSKEMTKIKSPKTFASSSPYSSLSSTSSSKLSSSISCADYTENGTKFDILNNHNDSNLPMDVKSGIVLVIVFKSNDPAVHIQMANFYDFMYGRHFRHIFYCTSGTDNIDMFAKMYPQPMSVIDLKISDPTLYSYLCLSEVMRMYHVSVLGYLHLDSETLLNPWTINSLTPYLDKPWINSGTTRTKLYQPDLQTANIGVSQIWKDKGHGRKALNSSIQDLLFISKIIDKHIGATNTTSNQEIVQYLTKYNKIVKKFLGKFNTMKLSQFEVRYGVSLVYYIPTTYREQFIVLADEFSRYNVHSYIVIPTIIDNLNSNFLVLNGTILTTRHTSSILSAYRPNDSFLYPWEMYLVPVTKRSKFMCNVYLPYLEESLTK